MIWDRFLTWQREANEIADATTYGTVLMLERAPEGADLLEHVAVAAPAMMSAYAQASKDSAHSYVNGVRRDMGYGSVLQSGAASVVTWEMLKPVMQWALSDVAMPWTVEEVAPRMVQGSTRLVSNIGRETVQSAVGDLDGLVGRRVPRPDACAWCRLQSAVPHSTGEWPESSYHGNCRCRPILFPADGSGELPDDVLDLWDEFERQWLEADSWARVRQAEIDQDLWEQAQGTSMSARKRAHSSLRRRELPTLQQLTLSRIREQYGAR